MQALNTNEMVKAGRKAMKKMVGIITSAKSKKTGEEKSAIALQSLFCVALVPAFCPGAALRARKGIAA